MNAALESQPTRVVRHRRLQYGLRTLFVAILSASIGLSLVGTMTPIAMRRMRPPLIKEYQRIQEEIYTRYLIDGVLPAPGDLSASAQKTLSEHPEIQFTSKEGLSYRYDKPYPINVPLTGLLTLGSWWGGESCCNGVSERPEILIHNARLRADESRQEPSNDGDSPRR
jgi:hypothetical protein